MSRYLWTGGAGGALLPLTLAGQCRSTQLVSLTAFGGSSCRPSVVPVISYEMILNSTFLRPGSDACE